MNPMLSEKMLREVDLTVFEGLTIRLTLFAFIEEAREHFSLEIVCKVSALE